MKKYIKYFSLPLVYAGVLILFISFFAGWTNHNWILILSLAMITIGIANYVIIRKQQSKY